jgi:hypothetical protein
MVTKRPVLVISVKLLTTGFYRLKGGHSLPEAVRPQGGQEMLVVWRDSGTDMRAHLLPSLPIETPAECNLEGGGTGDGLESGQMQTCAGL